MYFKDLIIDFDNINMTIDFNNINMDIDFSFLDLQRGYKQMRYNKYYNKKTIVDGIEFDSKLESKRYIELKLLEKARQNKRFRATTNL